MSVCGRCFLVFGFWVAARYVNTNSSNANFGLRNANTNTNGYNMFNSDGNTNGNNYALRPVDSIHCGYAIINCIRDNIETNRCPVACKSYKCKIDKYFVSREKSSKRNLF